AIIDYKRCHSGSALGSRYNNSIDHSLVHAWTLADDICQFGGRNIFPFPAEGVTDAIDKIEESTFISAHQVACAKPDVPSDKDIAQKLCFRRELLRITLKLACSDRTMLCNPANRLTDFVRRAADAESILVALRLTSVVIEFHQRQRKPVL